MASLLLQLELFRLSTEDKQSVAFSKYFYLFSDLTSSLTSDMSYSKCKSVLSQQTGVVKGLLHAFAAGTFLLIVIKYAEIMITVMMIMMTIVITVQIKNGSKKQNEEDARHRD